ncbi:MAG: exosome protein [Thaumarchaeota archaeon]|mgnify:FL=1|jgi:RNA binding exosome subunit|nr:MAG: exosome protein [Nitrososphaerota archaeon]
MVTKINLKIEIIVHATEDYQKISDSLCDIFEIESSEITKKEFSGHFGNPILMLHIQMKNKRAEGLIKKLISTISRDDVKDLLAGMDERISDSTLYLRFSKQNFVKKTLTFQEKDPVRIMIFTPVYIKKNVVKTYKKLLESNCNFLT